MELHEPDLGSYLRFAAPDLTDEQRVKRLARLREAVERGDRKLADIRVAKDPAGQILAALRLVPAAGGGTLLLAGPFLVNDDDAAASLVPEAMRRAHVHGARTVRCRPEKEAVGPLYRAALVKHGFENLGERIEFRAPVADLPLDDGTPLSWRNLADIGRGRAADLLQEVASGDPHGREEGGDPGAALAEWLGAPRLTTGPDCVQVGFLEQRAVAFVCAQVSPHDGWSRIAYLGLAPDVRGRGLGAWVHRRGFRILREQGGRTYHGGTAASNPRMLRLFRKHGCTETMRLLEFEWRAPT